MTWCQSADVARALNNATRPHSSQAERATSDALLTEWRETGANYGDALAEVVCELGPNGSGGTSLGFDQETSTRVRLAAMLALSRLVGSGWRSSTSMCDKPQVVKTLLSVPTESHPEAVLLRSAVIALARICAEEFPTEEWEFLLNNLGKSALLYVRGEAAGEFSQASIVFIAALSDVANCNAVLSKRIADSGVCDLVLNAPFSHEHLRDGGDAARGMLVSIFLSSRFAAALAHRQAKEVLQFQPGTVDRFVDALCQIDFESLEAICGHAGSKENAHHLADDDAGQAVSAVLSGKASLKEIVVATAINIIRVSSKAAANDPRVPVAIRQVITVLASGPAGAHIASWLASEAVEALHAVLSSATKRSIFAVDDLTTALFYAAVSASDVADFFSDAADRDAELSTFTDDELADLASSALMTDASNEEMSVGGCGGGSLRDAAGALLQQYVEDDAVVNMGLIIDSIAGYIGSPTVDDVAAHLRASTAMQLLGDASRQCHEDAYCSLDSASPEARQALLQVVAGCTQLESHLATTPLSRATGALLRCRALLLIANLVEQTGEEALVDGALAVVEGLLAAHDSAYGNLVASVAALALNRIVCGSLVATQRCSQRVNAAHVEAAAACAKTAFGAYAAASLTRTAVSSLPYNSCLGRLWGESSDALRVVVTALLQHSTNPALASAATSLLTSLIEEHGNHPSSSACSTIQQLCGLVISVASSEQGSARLLRCGIECASQVVLTSQACGGCQCSPHVGHLVDYVDFCARNGPFDDALTRRVASAIGACATVNFESAMPGSNAPKSLQHAAICLVRDSVKASTSAFNTSCMAYGLTLIAHGLHSTNADDISSDFESYVAHLGSYILNEASDFAVAGCLLPLAVMMAVTPAATAELIARSCSLSSSQDPRALLRTRRQFSAVMSLWFAVVPNADTRTQSFSLAAWLRLCDLALQGHEASQYVLATFGADSQAATNDAMRRTCTRFMVLRTLHPRRSPKDTSTSPASLLRDATAVTIAEGIALTAYVLRHSARYHVTQLASFASHLAFDQLNLTRWGKCPLGYPLPNSVLGGMLGGGGVIIVPYLCDALSGMMHSNLPALLQRFDSLRLEAVEPNCRQDV
jgi:hypothetical protein